MSVQKMFMKNLFYDLELMEGEFERTVINMFIIRVTQNLLNEREVDIQLYTERERGHVIYDIDDVILHDIITTSQTYNSVYLNTTSIDAILDDIIVTTY